MRGLCACLFCPLVAVVELYVTNLFCPLDDCSFFAIAVVAVVPQWGAADAEFNIASNENTELKGTPFNTWSRSVYSHACYAYCQGFLPC